MADTGLTICGTGANDSGTGSVAWSNPTNITADTGNYANVDDNSTTSQLLEATNFGFSVPDGATINGIQIMYDIWATDNLDPEYLQSHLMKAGTPVGNNIPSPGTSIPSSRTDDYYGGATELWGTTWTASDINNTNFGVQLQVEMANRRPDNIQVYSIWVRVYYTEGGGGGEAMQVNIGDDWKDISGAQINIGDSWKVISGVQINIGDTWKTIW